MGRVFISYSRKDETFARQLADRLGSVAWIDVKDLGSEELERCNSTGVEYLSGNGSDYHLRTRMKKSKNVEDEWQYHLDHKKLLIPVLLEPPSTIHFQLNRLQYINFYNQDFETAFAQLDSALRNPSTLLQPFKSAPFCPTSSPDKLFLLGGWRGSPNHDGTDRAAVAAYSQCFWGSK